MLRFILLNILRITVSMHMIHSKQVFVLVRFQKMEGRGVERLVYAEFEWIIHLFELGFTFLRVIK
jgi:hypothetical protein